MPLARQSLLDRRSRFAGRMTTAELTVPADVNTLIVRLVPDAAEWATSGKEILFGIERQSPSGVWEHVVSSWTRTDGQRPLERDGTPRVALYVRQMLQLTRNVGGREVKADDFLWAGQRVRGFCQTTARMTYELTIEGQQLTDQERIATLEVPAGVL